MSQLLQVATRIPQVPLGPELAPDFVPQSNWLSSDVASWWYNSPNWNYSNVSLANIFASNVNLQAGHNYEFVLTIAVPESPPDGIFALFNASSSQNYTGYVSVPTGQSQYSTIITPAANTTGVRLYGNPSGDNFIVTSISIREVM